MEQRAKSFDRLRSSYGDSYRRFRAAAAVGGEAGLSAVSIYMSGASHRLHVSERLHLGTFSKSAFADWVASSHEMHLSANFHSAFEIDDAGFGAHAAPQDGPLKVR